MTYTFPTKRGSWPEALLIFVNTGERRPDQKMTPLVFNVPFKEVEDHALVYGDLTARGTAGGRAGE